MPDRESAPRHVMGHGPLWAQGFKVSGPWLLGGLRVSNFGVSSQGNPKKPQTDETRRPKLPYWFQEKHLS